MRDIKFRAINAKDEMIYGLPYTDGTNETVYFKEYSNRLCWRNEDGAHCNQPYKNGTLMQYTGLKDKNGVEIYEGDIIKSTFAYKDKNDTIIGIVEEDACNPCFVIHYKYNGDGHDCYEYDFVQCGLRTNEVIGNIHQHKHLLK